MSNIASTVITALVGLLKKAPSIVTDGHQTEAETALADLFMKATEGSTVASLIDGAIAMTTRVAKITKASVGAFTLAAPDHEGQRMTIVSTTAFAHVVTATNLINDGVAGGVKDTITFGAFVGASIELIGMEGAWTVTAKNVATVA